MGSLRAAFREIIPPPIVIDPPSLAAADTRFLIADQTSLSTYSLPAQWELVPAGVWGPVKVAAERSWKLVGRTLQMLQIYSATLPVMPAQVAPMDPVLAAIQAQLAQQKADHEAAVAALKATVDAQQAQLIATVAALAAPPPPLSPELQALIAEFEAAPLCVDAWPLDCLDVLSTVLDFHGSRLARFLLASGTAHFGANSLLRCASNSIH
ncbi:hypothetical protein CYMTET_22927 [Cymbomonas tetramitiformis]|uniref:Uncharacterized protein n=1 Tax=Cymbomonas tetramitiformis TaxID=36881 RepID=A0AAE0FZA3_9CHLO|nr:hypothetical protein CYMTET_22927 [Cymbomonas tetramitiformis]